MLLMDIGNTRAKWAVLADGRLSRGGAVLHRGVPPADWLHRLDEAGSSISRVLVSNVAGEATERIVDEWSLARHGVQAEFVRATRTAGGIENAYDHPESLGADRWLGMIGAWKRVGAPLVYLAAGTAMTVDALDRAGRHLGGLIVPGRDMMVDALLHRTSDIARATALAPPVAAGMFGHNTAAAVELGSVHALAALADRAIRWVESRVGVPPRVFLGGGDASRLEPLMDTRVELTPDLVLEGLVVIAEAG